MTIEIMQKHQSFHSLYTCAHARAQCAHPKRTQWGKKSWQLTIFVGSNVSRQVGVAGAGAGGCLGSAGLSYPSQE